MVVACALLATAAAAQPLPDDVSSLPWVVDGGIVEAETRAGNRIYVGGSFHAVARPSDVIGPFGAFDASSAALLAADPTLTGGQMRAVVSDGAGGWIVGGQVVTGNQLRALVRLDAAGRQVAWPADVAGVVYALARVGNTLYVGGSFNGAGGDARVNLAAFDIPTGALLPWNPGAVGGGVYALAASGADLFIGGSFTSVGGASRSNLAAVDAASGAVSPWAPAISGTGPSVFAIAATASTVWIGGSFDSVGGVARRALAAVDRASGAVQAVAPNPGGGAYQMVFALALRGSTLYMGGAFTDVAGTTRYNAAAIEAATGLLLSWAPLNDVEGIVRTIVPTADGLVLGGDLGLPGRRRHLAKVDAITGAAVAGWDPSPGWDVMGLALDGTRLGVAGFFATYRANPARGLAGFDLDTGAAIALPAVYGRVRAVAASATTLYVGGFLYSVGAQPRQHLAAIDLATRTVTPFAPSPSHPVLGLHLSGTTLYAGGAFTTVNGQPRESLAAFDTTNGQLRSFSAPSFGGVVEGVTQLQTAGGRLWAAGSFATVGGQARAGLAAFDAVTGALDPIDLAPDAPPALAADSTYLYLSGRFTSLAGQPRAGLARLDAQSGTLDTWSPPNLQGAGTIGVAGGIVVASATDAPPYGPGRPLALDPASGVPLGWSAPGTPDASRVAAFADGVFLPDGVVGGSPRYFARRAGGALQPLADFGVHLQGTVLTLRWTPALTGLAPTSYRLVASSAPGASDLANLVLGPGRSFTASVPPGRYFVRLVPQANGVDGPPTPELGIVSGASGCVAPPASPALVVNAGVLSWSPVNGVSGYEVRAGTSPGVLRLVTIPVGAGTTSLATAGAPPGTYYAAVAAVNACGSSAASNEVQVVIAPPAAPAAPTALSAAVAGSSVALSWSAPPGAVTGYVLEAGTSPGLANLVPGLALGTTPLLLAPNVPSGTYYVRVRAANGALVSSPSNEIVVTVP